MAPDAKRTRVWFPLFAFFESKCEGRVPNQFEYPVPHIVPYFSMLTAWTVSSCGSVDKNNVQNSLHVGSVPGSSTKGE